MFFTAVLQAVKKGPNSSGGLVWKTHRFWKVSKTRKANALKKLKLVQNVDSVLKDAVKLEAAGVKAACVQNAMSPQPVLTHMAMPAPPTPPTLSN